METSLYLPVKRFLEGLGYTVKGEIGHCDLVGLRDDDPAVGWEVCASTTEMGMSSRNGPTVMA